MKLFFVYGVTKFDDYPLIKLYGVYSSRSGASKFIEKQLSKSGIDEEKFCFKAFKLDEPWKSDLYIPESMRG